MMCCRGDAQKFDKGGYGVQRIPNSCRVGDGAAVGTFAEKPHLVSGGPEFCGATDNIGLSYFGFEHFGSVGVGNGMNAQAGGAVYNDGPGRLVGITVRGALFICTGTTPGVTGKFGEGGEGKDFLGFEYAGGFGLFIPDYQVSTVAVAIGNISQKGRFPARSGVFECAAAGIEGVSFRDDGMGYLSGPVVESQQAGAEFFEVIFVHRQAAGAAVQIGNDGERPILKSFGECFSCGFAFFRAARTAGYLMQEFFVGLQAEFFFSGNGVENFSEPCRPFREPIYKCAYAEGGAGSCDGFPVKGDEISGVAAADNTAADAELDAVVADRIVTGRHIGKGVDILIVTGSCHHFRCGGDKCVSDFTSPGQQGPDEQVRDNRTGGPCVQRYQNSGRFFLDSGFQPVGEYGSHGSGKQAVFC